MIMDQEDDTVKGLIRDASQVCTTLLYDEPCRIALQHKGRNQALTVDDLAVDSIRNMQCAKWTRWFFILDEKPRWDTLPPCQHPSAFPVFVAGHNHECCQSNVSCHASPNRSLDSPSPPTTNTPSLPSIRTTSASNQPRA